MKKLTHFETKKETKTVEVESQVEVVDGYQAVDGRVFVDEASCLKHEKELADEARFLSVPHFYVDSQDLFDNSYEEDQIVVVMPRTQEEIEIICGMSCDIDAGWFACGKATAMVLANGGFWRDRRRIEGTNNYTEGKERFAVADYAYEIGDPDIYFGTLARKICKIWSNMKFALLGSE